MAESIAQTHSVFEQPWWLDAAAGGQWDAVEVEEGGRVVARLPFVVKRAYGMRVLTQPPLTQTLGPWLEGADEPPTRRLAREKDLFAKLIARLPKFDAFQQSFHPNVTNWLPFYWQGFSQTTRYSYVLNDIGDLDRVFKEMSSSTRTHIRRAEKSLTVVSSEGVEEVLEMVQKTFQRQRLPLPYDPDLLRGIDEAAKTHAQRRALFGVDEEGRIHSAVYVVGDARRAYSLVTGADPELWRSGSGSLVHWNSIQAAAPFTNVFDFEGSMIEGIEESYRRFGASQSPYSSVSKQGGLFARAAAVRRLIQG